MKIDAEALRKWTQRCCENWVDLERLQSVLDSYSAEEVTVIIGDLNCRVGSRVASDCDEVCEVLGPGFEVVGLGSNLVQNRRKLHVS